LAAAQIPAAIAELARILREGSTTARILAAKALLDRAVGTPPASLDVQHEQAPAVHPGFLAAIFERYPELQAADLTKPDLGLPPVKTIPALPSGEKP
jgi:hypothetical protein